MSYIAQLPFEVSRHAGNGFAGQQFKNISQWKAAFSSAVGEVRAVDDVSFAIAQGETVSPRAKAGGKTTTSLRHSPSSPRAAKFCTAPKRARW
ncbi:MAG: hypothetical protein H6645_10215 [Caldilineaceae bacterium]|nr:hypothetical protein [Caldilineaceae bacterium]